ncbi:NAD-dependent succinate-semialdehyde dehydrogenase [Granulicoccus phenolivorans]|uniref:NAD-dependent succinate-semialdehyde dehydrogenase n=1 Tax=Granulicoccus phenolivorans TaxID=266854 RepID=UPI00047B7642|nr:NAD-dependent succinate-semialdehyde dehydrogenase [Granulicoccus phenolivorans]
MSRYRTTNPATGELLQTFPTLTDEELEQRVRAAVEAYRSWRTTTPEERAAILARAAELYEERAEHLAQTITREMGKPITAARGEIKTVTGIFQYYATEGPAALLPEPIEVRGTGSAYIRREPLGVLLGVMPWNFPHYQVARFVAPSLLVGNAVMLKHASNCAASALEIEQLLHDAGVPEGVYTNLFADHQHVEALVADDRIQGVSLTGSDAVGARIGRVAGENVKKAVLELGGSDPFVVLDDADVEKAAAGAVQGRLVNGGQTCTSSKRIIVVDAIYDRFMEHFLEKMGAVAFGDPLHEDTLVGPLSSASAVEEVDELVRDAVDKGAEVLLGGKPRAGEGAYYEPTVLTGVGREARAFSEEIFGPVAVVYRAGDEQQAIDMANDSPYGLSSSVYSEDPNHAQRVGAELETGMVWVNSTSKSSAELPFGGVKKSGFGRELGRLGLEEFANRKLIRIP